MAGRRVWTFAQVELFMQRCLENVPRDKIAEELEATVRQVTSLWYEMRSRKGFTGMLAHRRPVCGQDEFVAKIPEIRRMCGEGIAHRVIAVRLELPVYRVWKYVSDNRLIPEDHQKNRPAQKRQVMQLPVNVQRVRLPDVDEADVKLAERVWREHEEGKRCGR